jgi:uncharacterized UBP type Zn finger protein
MTYLQWPIILEMVNMVIITSILGHYTAYVLKNIENREVWVHCDDD